MRILATAALFALLAGPAHAQGMNLMMPDTPKDPVAEQRRLENERAYNAAKQKIPDQKPAANDPWGNVRTTPDAKTTSVRPRTGTR